MQQFYYWSYILRSSISWEEGHQSFRDFKKAYDSASREAFYNTLIQLCIPIKTDKDNIVYE